jgi:hypothetical protein
MGFLLLGNLIVNDQGTGRFLITKARKAPKGNRIPLEPSYGHLPETPSHDFLQKVRGPKSHDLFRNSSNIDRSNSTALLCQFKDHPLPFPQYLPASA